MKKTAVGSILEFQCSKGLAYAQLTHRHAQYAELLRVFEGFYQTRPVDFIAVSLKPLRFSAFIHLSSAVKQSMATVVGQAPVRPELQPFPLFRAGNYDFETKTMGPWWLWDGEKRWSVETLTEEELMYPKLGVWNARLIVDRLDAGWIEKGSVW